MENFNISFPISFVKKEERVVVGIATADNIDKSGDVVDFNASVDAFKNWAGNIREMHSPIAVGKAINYEPVKIKGEDGEEYNAIKVEAYISKGAQDTWEKVLDGTLRAFSIGGSIMEKAADDTRMFRGRPVNIIKKYRLGELSLVDNPANALATVDIIKMNNTGDLEYVLEDIMSKAGKQPLKDPKGGLTAAGRRHFKQTEGANLKPGVKGPADTPEKMRRKGSFLTRFFTNPSGPMKDEKGRPTRLALSAAAWGEPVPQNAQDAARLAAKGRRLLERYQNTKKKNKSIEDILIEDEDILQKEMNYFNSDEFISIEELDILLKNLDQWFREEWVDISRPKPGGGFEPCGRDDAGKGKYPKCVPASKAAKMTQAEIDSAVRRKRTAESTTRRKDKKPIYVSTEKAESINVPTNPALYARVKAEAKRKFRVYPSAYANAWLVREYKKRGGGYRMAKDGEVTTGSMGAGIKNPTQGYGKPKRKKELGMKKYAEDSGDLLDTLDEVLSNGIVLYFSAHRAHWNVEGPDFFEYHQLFGEIYDDIYGSIDTIAENIRKFGGFANPLSVLEDSADLEDDSATSDAKALALNLYMKNMEYIVILKNAFDVANQENEQGIANFIAERIDKHQKWNWQLKSSLMSSGVDIEIPEETEDSDEDSDETADTGDIMDMLNEVLNMFESSEEDTEENTKSIDFANEELLQNDVEYDNINDMNDDNKEISLFKKFLKWLSSNDIEQASTETTVEVIDNPQEEEEMDIDILKAALGEVVDQKLADFGTSIKEDVEASVQSKIDELTKSLEADKSAIQEKLDATEKALSDQEEQVKAFAKSGAVKKSVDTVDEEEELAKSEPANETFWDNTYLPQGLISALGYKS